MDTALHSYIPFKFRFKINKKIKFKDTVGSYEQNQNYGSNTKITHYN